MKNMIFETILSSNKDFYIAEFSGGLETNLVNERYAKIEVKEFYGNLMYFYKSFKKTQIINLAVLTYGKNYKVFIILRLYEKLKEMFFLNSFQALNVENIIPLIQEEINIDELKEDKEKVISWIMKSKSIDKNDVIYIVERWIARYL
ncbi:MAG: hypothetical protein N2490_06065 [Ignavibacteria bacterium]|nr:hypothetical protein [Ignavibacteria bacterium]